MITIRSTSSEQAKTVCLPFSSLDKIFALRGSSPSVLILLTKPPLFEETGREQSCSGANPSGLEAAVLGPSSQTCSSRTTLHPLAAAKQLSTLRTPPPPPSPAPRSASSSHHPRDSNNSATVAARFASPRWSPPTSRSSIINSTPRQSWQSSTRSCHAFKSSSPSSSS